jgi:HSP20 family molecular chaperone IbpA
MENLQKRMMGSMLIDIEKLEKSVENGELQGSWQYEPIEKPGIRGFIIRGSFSTPNPLERPTDILPPLKPKPRGPREPLYDIAVGKDKLEIYIELPGVEEDEIQLDAKPERLQVMAKDFQTEIKLSSWALETEKMTNEYRNGVLKVVIPKKEFDEQLI